LYDAEHGDKNSENEQRRPHDVVLIAFALTTSVPTVCFQPLKARRIAANIAKPSELVSKP
jgi:hypothetical protein